MKFHSRLLPVLFLCASAAGCGDSGKERIGPGEGDGDTSTGDGDGDGDGDGNFGGASGDGDGDHVISDTPVSGARAMSMGTSHDCVLLRDGKVACWGSNTRGQSGSDQPHTLLHPGLVAGVNSAVAIASGSQHTCALLDDGHLLCWGHNDAGQLGARTEEDWSASPVMVEGVSDAVALFAGDRDTCALLQDGSAKCWGYLEQASPISDQLDSCIQDISISAVGRCAIVAGGGVRCWGGQQGLLTQSGITDVRGIWKATAIDPGDVNACAVTEDGDAMCFGTQRWSEAEDSTTYMDPRVRPVQGLHNVAALSMGLDHSCAIDEQGDVWCWGNNGNGQLGDGTRDASLQPVQVLELPEKAVSIEVSVSRSCAILDDEGVMCWGLGSGLSTNTPLPLLGPSAQGTASIEGLESTAPSASECEGGPCSPGTNRCFGNTTQKCGADHYWQTPEPCSIEGHQCGEDGKCTEDPPSCVDLPETCGAGSDQNCCESLLVAGGSFYLGWDHTVNWDPEATTHVSDFRLDQFEVSVGRFRKFVDAWVNGYRPTNDSGIHAHVNGGEGLTVEPPNTQFETGWDERWNQMMPQTAEEWDIYLSGTDPSQATWLKDEDRLPINFVRSMEMYAFCIWDGGFLPTRAELNYAAAGGDEQRVYPWSVPPESTDIDSTHSGCIDGYCPPVVGSFPAGDARWGQADLGSGVSETMLDTAQARTVCADCVNMNPQSVGHLAQYYGGNFDRSAITSLGTSWGHNQGGGRCARAP